MLQDVSQPIRHNTEIKLFVGASERVGRLRLLGTDMLKAGEEGWLQLELNDPIVVIRGDRYILRRPSPGETLGGGIILDAQPKGRHKRYDEAVLKRLEALVEGSPEDILLQSALALGITTKREILDRSDLEISVALEALEKLLENNELVALEPGEEPAHPNSLLVSAQIWSQLTTKALGLITNYQDSHPLRKGMPREEFKSNLNLSSREFTLAVNFWLQEGVFSETALRDDLPGGSALLVIHTPDNQIEMTSDQKAQIDRLLARFAENPYAPPTIKECIADIKPDLFNAMIDLAYLIPLNPEVVFRKEDYEKFVLQIHQMLKKSETISVAQVRDQFQTSRRYVLALLEHLDHIGVTVREGDGRRLKKR
jgi:selenocysteine-specific elongation factor